MKRQADDRSVMILDAEGVKEIDWQHPEVYNFTATPDFVRRLLVGSFIREQYEHYRGRHLRQTDRTISQNNYATNIVGIDHVAFSLIKNGHNLPSYEQADVMAAFYGPIIWDMCGYSRRMPVDKKLYKIADLWPKLSERAQAEILERSLNLYDNGDVKEDEKDGEKGLDTDN